MANRIQTTSIGAHSSSSDLLSEMNGQYGFLSGTNYYMILVKSVGFIFTLGNASVTLPSHHPFTFEDDNGRHLVSEDVNSLDVAGITAIQFLFK